MKVLIIDDDIEIRKDTLMSFWRNRGADYFYWLDNWPENFLEFLEENDSLTHISFDHDLGHTDVTVELNKLLYFSHEKYRTVFKAKHVVIHSMNPIGAANIAGKLLGYARNIEIIPLHEMV